MSNDPELDEAIRLYGLVGVHPDIEQVPRMTEAEEQALAADAVLNGWLRPVTVTSDGWLVDGRSRLVVSVRIRKDVPVERLDPVSVAQHTYSANVARRHLTAEQIDEVMTKARKMYAHGWRMP